ncbi:hypothetical protein K440DRAFT_666494 [Wilcoxina mikolae CBS 423.85]|nr:hypothetical protein K440DRAFT_666494 [Wilcoxina mikolae CBS 423.85]
MTGNGRIQYDYKTIEDRPKPTLEKIIDFIATTFPILRLRKPHTTYTSPWVLAVAEMISSLAAGANPTYPQVVLSLPNLLADTRHIYFDHFRFAWKHAGVQEFNAHSDRSIRSALKHYQMEDCYDEDGPACEKIKTLLSIDYSGASLRVTLLTEYLGMLYPKTIAEYPDFGASSSLRLRDADRYWAQVEELIKGNTTDAIDYLILLGDRATDADFLGVVRKIFRRNGNIKTEDYVREAEEHVFAPARGVASAARFGMMTGFDACMVPDYCPKGEEEWGWRYEL